MGLWLDCWFKYLKANAVIRLLSNMWAETHERGGNKYTMKTKIKDNVFVIKQALNSALNYTIATQRYESCLFS